MKTGIIAPVFKNKNSLKHPDNYRRITVTSIVGNVLEKVMVRPTKEVLKKRLIKLQRGFCTASSSINTVFLISEALAEAKDCNETLYTCFLDASKAFDVVWHEELLYNLYQHGVSDDLRLLYRSLYTKMSSQVKWDGKCSEVFHEAQGVWQGGIPSTKLFKARCDPLLWDLEKSMLGYSIGLVDVSAPTCADHQ